MGLSPKRKLKSNPWRLLRNGIIISLMTMGSSRICSHQQVDDHRKGENYTHNNQTNNRVS